MLPDFAKLRQRMVDEQLIAKGIKDKRVLETFRKIPRHLFVPEYKRVDAYIDYPLPIGLEQTISQPYIVAFMIQALALTGSEKVLEIGTGSGYQTAILAELTDRVYTIEIVEKLSQGAFDRLAQIGYKNIEFKLGDGSLGWQEEAPFDRIVVSASLPDMPITLISQLKQGGIMLAPIGDIMDQILYLIKRESGKVKREPLIKCLFVKLLGEEGWQE